MFLRNNKILVFMLRRKLTLYEKYCIHFWAILCIIPSLVQSQLLMGDTVLIRSK